MGDNRRKILYEIIVQNILDDSEESSDSDTAEVIQQYLGTLHEQIPKIRCKNYIEDVVWKYTDVDFKSHFR